MTNNTGAGAADVRRTEDNTALHKKLDTLVNGLVDLKADIQQKLDKLTEGQVDLKAGQVDLKADNKSIHQKLDKMSNKLDLVTRALVPIPQNIVARRQANGDLLIYWKEDALPFRIEGMRPS